MDQHQLVYKHICFKYKGNKDLLFYNLDVTIQTGELVGILGTSGSGKTTLTEILLDKLSPTCDDFQIYEDGQVIKGDQNRWSYVPQKNLLRDFLTISQTFTFYADIHLPGESKGEKEFQISQILHDLGLWSLKDKKISQLSGGQQRRVSIGVELLSKSRYFILDEPSSGLDALSDRNLLRTLKILAKSRNKAIIVITHNTENLNILDKIIFLSQGLPKFVGSFPELLKEFKTTDDYTISKFLDMNIAEVYQELLASGKIYKI
ncbi:hypothetical protein BI362_11075 [Streptococcus parauberis]|uniref:ABC transporter ATP-binding protein n=2 Tax=Streptococcus TaxID=1301 RepID=A0AAE4L1A0_9STRE|nr:MULTISPECIES: ABC transporter ATP-binding protein [Streptococcus]MDT2732734.1 ABC transporter ATP-binding protein [Streptococcus parauberis]OHY29305.1 hypothetical protein BI362_11075 [Streptococcus parauberis]OJF71692.1 hypothetical protein A9Q68_06810 [Streptococcus bovimastitidis]